MILALLASLAASAKDLRAYMTLEVNTVERGEALVVLRDGDVLVPTAALEAAGLLIDEARTEYVDGTAYLSLRSLRSAIESWSLDDRALKVRITARIDRLAPTVVDLRRRQPPDLVRGHDASGFFNYSLQLDDFARFSGYAEAGVSLWGGLLYSGMSIDSSTWKPVRGLSYLMVDRPAQMQRITVGDAFVSTGILGGGMFLGGVTLARNFGLDPYFVRQPMLGYAGATLVPATLEVYVNGALVRRQALPPGPFQLRDVPATVGSGDTRYVLRDAFGQETVLSSQYYLPAGVLARGVQDYSVSLGFRRNHVGTSSFDYQGLPAILGYHRMGITDWFTLGERVEITTDRVSGGVAIDMRTPIGEFEAGAAGSTAKQGSGGASTLAWAWLGRHFSGGLRATVTSDRYSTLSLDPELDRATLDLTASVSVPIGSRVSTSAQYGLLVYRDAPGYRHRVSAQGYARLTGRLSLMLSGSYLIGDNERPSLALYAGLSVAFGGTVSGRVGYRQVGRSAAGEVELQRPLPAGNGLGYRFQGHFGQDEQRVDVMARYQGTYGLYSAEARMIDGQEHTTLTMAGGIVALRGAGVFFTRPVRDGFAVIRVPGVEGVRGYLDNQEIGRTDSRGNLVVPTLLPYYGNRLSIADGDVPVDRSLDVVARVMAPTWRGGVLAVFPARRHRYVRGRLVIVAEGREQGAPSFGQVALSMGDRALTSPLGRQGEFDLEEPPSGTFAAEAEWDGGRCRAALTVPEDDAPVIQLGAVPCVLIWLRPEPQALSSASLRPQRPWKPLPEADGEQPARRNKRRRAVHAGSQRVPSSPRARTESPSAYQAVPERAPNSAEPTNPPEPWYFIQRAIAAMRGAADAFADEVLSRRDLIDRVWTAPEIRLMRRLVWPDPLAPSSTPPPGTQP